MLNKLLDKLVTYLCKSKIQVYIVKMEQLRIQHNQALAQLAEKTENNAKLTSHVKNLEEMLANRNALAVKAQTLYVSEHAVHRYKERIGYKGSDDELKKMIYSQTLKHLATMDTLPDGNYDINSQASVRVKDNTVCTVVRKRKR